MIRQFPIYKLNFSAPLHLSRGRNTYDRSSRVLHSDTIKAALISTAYFLGWPEADIQAMDEQCQISSAFPFLEDQFFFPKLNARMMPIAEVPGERQGKFLKKLQFLDQHYFEQLLLGIDEPIPQQHLLDKGSYATSAFEQDDTEFSVFELQLSQRVTIAPDQRSDAVPFYAERIHFAERAGLWFMVQLQDDSWLPRIDGLMRLLGDNGIGTDRAVGNGFFDADRSTLELKVPDGASHQTNLSLFCPNQSELSPDLLEASSWQLIKRGGYLAGSHDEATFTLRKRSVFMFQEGSLFLNRPLVGKRVDLRPSIEEVQHPVWRDGRAIFLPINPIPSNV